MEEFDERVCVMKSVARFMNGRYRIAVRVVVEEMNTTDEVRVEKVEVVPPLPQIVAVSGITGWIDPETQVDESVGVVQQKGLARVVGGKSEV